MTQNAHAIMTNLAAITGPLPGNTVDDVAAQCGLDQGQMASALDALQDAGMVRVGALWSRIGDHRQIVALGVAQYGPTVGE
jgi:predicted transcriptional regulator